MRRRLDARAIAEPLQARILDEHFRVVAAAGAAFVSDCLAGETPVAFLELTNFGSYAHLVLDFSHLGLAAVIVGPNGAGKTTLLEAMLFAKTGECRDSQDTQIRFGEAQMTVRYDWRQGDRLFRVTRTLSRRTKRAARRSSCFRNGMARRGCRSATTPWPSRRSPRSPAPPTTPCSAPASACTPTARASSAAARRTGWRSRARFSAARNSSRSRPRPRSAARPLPSTSRASPPITSAR